MVEFVKFVESYGTLGALVALLFIFHRQARGDLKSIKEGITEMSKAISDMSTKLERHTVELEHGAREFARIEEHQKTQDEKIHNLKNEIQGVALKVHSIKGRIVPAETIQAMIDASKSV